MKSNVMRVTPNLKLTTPTDLNPKARIAIAKVINPLIADAFALFVKTKNFHWHLSGKHYRDYHLLFDEQADQIFAMIDVLAERVRKLGATTIHSINHIKSLQRVKDDDDDFVSPEKMVTLLLEENIGLAERMRHAHKICDEHNDVATASFLEVYIDETERRSWFLYEVSV